MSPLRSQVLSLAAPVTIWAVHFSVLYALVSATCSPRALIDIPAMQAGMLVSTFLALVFAGLPLVRVPGSNETGDELPTAIKLTAIISVLAIIANAASFLFFASCGG